MMMGEFWVDVVYIQVDLGRKVNILGGGACTLLISRPHFGYCCPHEGT
jgi:hypothetical protein